MSEQSVPGTIVDEHDWMICSKIKRICAYWLGNKVDAQTFSVSCVCGTAGLAKSIGLGKVGQREKDLRLVKEILYTFL